MGMITQETTHTELFELLEQVKAEAERFNKNFGRPKLKLIKCGKPKEDSQKVASSDKKCPPITAAVRSKADKARFFANGLVLLSYHGERDKKRNGLAVIQRNRLKLIQGGKLTQAEEWQIQLLIAEWNGLQELKRLRGDK